MRRIKGRGVWDWAKKAWNAYHYRRNAVLNFGPRDNEPTGRFQDFLQKEGNKEIETVMVGRRPIVSGVHKAMDMLSLGNFSRAQRKLDYDEVYHQFLVVKYKDGTLRKIEKNHVVEVFDAKDADIKDVFFQTQVADGTTTSQLLKNASLNDDRFWQYDPAKNNCQIFVRDVIDRNNLLPQVDTSKVLETQDAQSLVNSLPWGLREIPLVVTNLASGVDKVIYGQGQANIDVTKARLMINGVI